MFRFIYFLINVNVCRKGDECIVVVNPEMKDNEKDL